MNNKRGFTIIELLAVITVLGLLIAIAIPAINKELAKFRLRYYKQVENTVKTAGQEYIDDKRFSKPTKLLYTKIVKVNDLVDKNYMEQIKDYNKKACDNDDTSYSYFVMIKTGDKKYEYQACLKCSDDEYITDTSDTELDLCNPAWLTNDYISYSGAASNDEVLWVYYGSSEEEVERQVGIKYGITKRDNKGNFVAQVEDDSVGSKTIYPDNINELVSANLDQIITLRYTLPNGEVLTRKAGLFRYGVPSVTMTYTNANTYSGKTAGASYGNGADEWANSITLTVGYNTTDRDKYSDFLNASDIHITGIEYYDSVNKKWKSYSCPGAAKLNCSVTLTDNFNGTVKYRLVDNKNRKTKETSAYSVKIDKNKPTCTVVIGSGTKGNNNWYTTNVGITMSARNDALSGIGKYGVGTSKVYDNNATKTHSTDTKSITYYGYVIDKAGNEETCNVAFKRDATKPICTITKTNLYYTTGVSLSAACSDPTSGCATGTQTASGVKANKTFSVTDNAGNTGNCTMSVTSGTRYRNRTCNTYSYCANSACGVNQYKSCATSACGVYRYKSCATSACGSYYRITNKSCRSRQFGLVNLLDENEAISACRRACSNAGGVYVSYNPGNCRCMVTDTSASYGSSCTSTGFTCTSWAHAGRTGTSCTWIRYNTCRASACGVESYKSCRTSGCGCQTWNSWTGSGTYYPEASCSASTNVRQCTSATVYW